MIYFLKHRKITLFLILTTGIFFYCIIVLFYTGISYSISPYVNNKTDTRGLYSYDLNGLRLLFSADKNIQLIPGMKLVHQNDFWDADRCAAMTPSIFKDEIFFVDKRNVINSNGEIVKKTYIYKYSFKTTELNEIKTTFTADKIYMHEKSFYITTTVLNKIILVFKINETNNTLTLRDFYLLPNGYAITYRSNYLELCNKETLSCEIKQKYIGFEDQRKMTKLFHDKEAFYFSYNGKDLTVSKKYKNVFLGY